MELGDQPLVPLCLRHDYKGRISSERHVLASLGVIKVCVLVAL